MATRELSRPTEWGPAAVSVVVERGLARCPRCVAVADYSFVETGPNSLRYEVLCKRCGEEYCEVHAPMTPDFSAAIEVLPPLVPEVRPTAFEIRRQAATAWITGLGERASAVAARVMTRITQAAKQIRR
jgi:hypothetical protein